MTMESAHYFIFKKDDLMRHKRILWDIRSLELECFGMNLLCGKGSLKNNDLLTSV